jgi:hypothetical protein
MVLLVATLYLTQLLQTVVDTAAQIQTLVETVVLVVAPVVLALLPQVEVVTLHQHLRLRATTAVQQVQQVQGMAEVVVVALQRSVEVRVLAALRGMAAMGPHLQFLELR